jgi:hypothetical protein
MEENFKIFKMMVLERSNNNLIFIVNFENNPKMKLTMDQIGGQLLLKKK